jgi:hypothetical protein
MANLSRAGIILFVAALTACSTDPVSLEQSTPITARAYSPAFSSYLTPAKDSAKIIVVRDSGILGAAVTANLFLDGKYIARLRPSESLTFYLPIGSYLIGVSPHGPTDWGIPATSGLIEQELAVEDASDRYFRITVDTRQGVVLQRSSAWR